MSTDGGPPGITAHLWQQDKALQAKSEANVKHLINTNAEDEVNDIPNINEEQFGQQIMEATRVLDPLPQDNTGAWSNIEVIVEDELQMGDLLPQATETGSTSVMSFNIPTIVSICGNVIGKPDEKALQTLGNPGKANNDSLSFRVTIVYPSAAPAYINVKVVIPNPLVRHAGVPWVEIGELSVPFAGLAGKPTVDHLTKDELYERFKLLQPSLKTCDHGAYILKFSCKEVHISRKERVARGRIRPTLRNAILFLTKKLQSTLKQKSTAEFQLYLPKHNEQDNEDYWGQILSHIDTIWENENRPGGPLSPYFRNSPNRRILTEGTILQPEERPQQPQLPPVTRYISKDHMVCAMAMSRKFENEFELKSKTQLGDIGEGLTARAFIPPSSHHPTDQSPLEYIVFVDFPEVLLSFAPELGDTVKLSFPTIPVIPRRVPLHPDAQGPRESQIAQHILGVFAEARDIEGDNVRQGCIMSGLHQLHSNSGEDIDKMVASFDEFCKGETEDEDDWYERIEQIVMESRYDWLDVPATLDSVDRFDEEPLLLTAKRIALSLPYLPTRLYAFQVSVPHQKVGKDEWLPRQLQVPVPPIDCKPWQFTRALMSENSVFPVKMYADHSDTTYKADMNALQKLSAPETWLKDDLPSQQMLDLFEDLIKLDFRMGHKLEECIPMFRTIRKGEAPPELMKEWNNLSKDKQAAFDSLSKSNRRLFPITGPPGTGKTRLALFIALAAMKNKTTRPSWDLDQPADVELLDSKELEELGIQRKVRVKSNAKPAADSTKTSKDAPASTSADAPGTSEPEPFKVLFVTGQNVACDDLLPRASSMSNALGIKDFKILRLYPMNTELRDMMGKAIPSHTVRPDGVPGEDEMVSSLTWKLIKSSVDTMKEQKLGQRVKVDHDTIVDLAFKMFNEDTTGKYAKLTSLIGFIKENMDQLSDYKKEIRSHLRSLFKDVLLSATFVVATPVACSATFFRKHYRPHLILFDEAARSTEISFLNVVAHFSPYIIIIIGDRLQCKPLNFSEHAHMKFRLRKRGFAKKKEEEGDEAEEEPDELAVQYEKYKDILDDKPRPNTWAKQMGTSLLARLGMAGMDTVWLTHNFRCFGSIIDFVNTQSYGTRLIAVNANTKGGQFDVVRDFMRQDAPEMRGSRIFVNMDQGREESSGTSYYNPANAHYGITKALDLLSVPAFTGKVVICSPYRAQITYYQQLLNKLRPREQNSEGVAFDFDHNRLELRTHQGVQGFEGSVVIVDFVRTWRAGDSANPLSINVFQSRAIHGEYTIACKSMIDSWKDEKSDREPQHQSLVALADHCDKKQAIIYEDGLTWKLQCRNCHEHGHTKKQCPQEFSIKCRDCGGRHHYRDCYYDAEVDAAERVREEAERQERIAREKEDRERKIAEVSKAVAPRSATALEIASRDANKKLREQFKNMETDGWTPINDPQGTDDQTTEIQQGGGW